MILFYSIDRYSRDQYSHYEEGDRLNRYDRFNDYDNDAPPRQNRHREARTSRSIADQMLEEMDQEERVDQDYGGRQRGTQGSENDSSLFGGYSKKSQERLLNLIGGNLVADIK